MKDAASDELDSFSLYSVDQVLPYGNEHDLYLMDYCIRSLFVHARHADENGVPQTSLYDQLWTSNRNRNLE